MDNRKTESTTFRITEWIKSDISRSILLLTGFILIAIIGVSLTSWWAYPLEDLQEMGFIGESNIYGVNTSGFSLSSLDAVKIALRESERRSVDHITVRPRNQTLVANRTVVMIESWEVHIWHSPHNSRKSDITWAFIDPYSGQVLSMGFEEFLEKPRS